VVLTWQGLFLIVGRLGEVALAANNIGVQVVHLLFLPGFAVGTAAAWAQTGPILHEWLPIAP